MDANSEIIDELLQNPERNFARLLFETPPIAVIEILAELVLHPENGHNAAIQCLYVWQDLQNNTYTLSSILEEIQASQNEVDIVCACLTLINRLMQHAPDSLKRIQIRRELEEIRFEEHLVSVGKCLPPSENLKNLTEKFKFLLHQPTISACVIPVVDINYTADADSGILSNDEEDVMNGTSENVKINGVEATENENNVTNKINNLISSIESSDALELLANLLKQIHDTKQSPTTVLKQLNENLVKLNETPTIPKPNGIVPAPPPLPKASIPPPPPPLLKSGSPIPPPPLIGQPQPVKQTKVEVPNALKPKSVPPDGKKLRHLQWTKIPINNLASTTSPQPNVWLKMGNLGLDLVKNLDLAQLDSYFACEVTAPETQSSSGNDKDNKSLTVSLLCGKRSLSVNVFLKSLKGLTDELIAYIRNGKSTEESGVEKLKMLVPLLPTEEEVQTLHNYSGSREELGAAERFLLQLLGVTDYRLRIESIILREEFEAFVSTVEPDLRTIILACQELRQSRDLQTVLLILLHMGNYLNHNAALGNAVGFKLASLWKIDELRAIKGGRTLLHLVAQQAEKSNSNLDEISHVEDASKLAFESIKNELKNSIDRVNKLENQLESKNDPFFTEMRTFLKDSKISLERSNELLDKIENERQQLAVYFCENEKTFSLEECFKIFFNFRSRFIIAANENRQREEREKRMQEKNLNTNQTTSTFNRSTLSPNETVKSSDNNRRASVIVEQDRDRNSSSSIISSSKRRQSMAHKNSPIFDKINFDNVDLDSHMDQALKENSQRRISHVSPVLSRVKESTKANTINEDKEVDEVKVEVPTIDSKMVSNENIKPTKTTPKQSPPLSRANKISEKQPVSTRIGTMRSTPIQTQRPEVKSSAYPMKISSIRARQLNEPVKKVQPTTPVQPLRPSQVRMAQNKTPTRPSLTTQASTGSNSSRQTIRSDNKTPTMLRKSTVPIRSSITTRAQPTNTNKEVSTTSRSAMSAAEKRSLFRQNTSLSTTSRPTLIRCGSKTEKPRWS